MRWMGGWSYQDLQSAPERVVEAIVDLLRKQSANEEEEWL